MGSASSAATADAINGTIGTARECTGYRDVEHCERVCFKQEPDEWFCQCEYWQWWNGFLVSVQIFVCESHWCFISIYTSSFLFEPTVVLVCKPYR